MPTDDFMALVLEYGEAQFRAGQLLAAIERNVALIQRIDNVAPHDPLATMRKAEAVIAAEPQEPQRQQQAYVHTGRPRKGSDYVPTPGRGGLIVTMGKSGELVRFLESHQGRVSYDDFVSFSDSKHWKDTHRCRMVSELRRRGVLTSCNGLMHQDIALTQEYLALKGVNGNGAHA